MRAENEAGTPPVPRLSTRCGKISATISQGPQDGKLALFTMLPSVKGPMPRGAERHSASATRKPARARSRILNQPEFNQSRFARNRQPSSELAKP
jgi:hypothetical protein